MKPEVERRLISDLHSLFLPCSFLQLWEDKEGKKKMNKNNAKALSTLRQKIRKYNRDFESHITNYKQVGVLEGDFLNCGDSDPHD